MSANAAAALSRARAALELDRWATAIEEAQRAVAADPTNAEALGVLAQAQHGKGEPKQAMTTLSSALELQPDNEWLHRLRASFLIEVRGRDALAAADEAVRLAPDIAWGHGLRARCLDKLGDRAEARKAIHRALELSPRTAWLHRTRGDIELHIGFPNEAERGYRKALECDARDAVAINNLGVALQRQGRHEEAALAFKTAVLTDPTMDVAKENTHKAVNNLTGKVAAGIGVGGLGAAKLCAMGGVARGVSVAGGTAVSHSDDGGTIIAVILAIIAIVLVVYLVARPIRRARGEARVKKLDPQLWQMYQQLERDKKSGRL